MPTESEPLTDILARFVAETPAADVPKAAVEPAKNVILDTIGVSLAAVNRSIGRIITSQVAETLGAPASATVLGAGLKVSPEMAALANGTLANALDFDDGSHLSTHILPAAIALVEHHRLPGGALLDAFIIAYEASARLTQTIDAKRRSSAGQPSAAGGMSASSARLRRHSRPAGCSSSIADRPRPRSGSRAAALAASGGTWGRWQRRCIPAMRRAPVSKPPLSHGGAFRPILRSSNHRSDSSKP
jgi:hypothetical protein